jgi:hypothetical protein
MLYGVEGKCVCLLSKSSATVHRKDIVERHLIIVCGNFKKTFAIDSEIIKIKVSGLGFTSSAICFARPN